ncbi:MAG: agmatinase [Pseudomonadota bacterium]
MKLHPNQFLGPDPGSFDYDSAAVAVLPFPYEGGVSYGRGTAGAPDAIIDASHQIELYDEVLKAEPYRMGIYTLASPRIPKRPEKMVNVLFKRVKRLLDDDKFVVVIGGDHSISSACVMAMKEKYRSLSVIQIDAHADLRDTYDGTPLSHACVMARIREKTNQTLQIGIRSMSAEEAKRMEREKLPVITMHEFRTGGKNLEAELRNLPDPVFLTVDVDAFDFSVIMSTGTPEPGGLMWDEALSLLHKIFQMKNIIGFDVVELSYAPWDRNSPIAAARLIYKMLGFKLACIIGPHGNWPLVPKGPILNAAFS